MMSSGCLPAWEAVKVAQYDWHMTNIQHITAEHLLGLPLGAKLKIVNARDAVLKYTAAHQAAHQEPSTTLPANSLVRPPLQELPPFHCNSVEQPRAHASSLQLVPQPALLKQPPTADATACHSVQHSVAHHNCDCPLFRAADATARHSVQPATPFTAAQRQPQPLPLSSHRQTPQSAPPRSKPPGAVVQAQKSTAPSLTPVHNHRLHRHRATSPQSLLLHATCPSPTPALLQHASWLGASSSHPNECSHASHSHPPRTAEMALLHDLYAQPTPERRQVHSSHRFGGIEEPQCQSNNPQQQLQSHNRQEQPQQQQQQQQQCHPYNVHSRQPQQYLQQQQQQQQQEQLSDEDEVQLIEPSGGSGPLHQTMAACQLRPPPLPIGASCSTGFPVGGYSGVGGSSSCSTNSHKRRRRAAENGGVEAALLDVPVTPAEQPEQPAQGGNKAQRRDPCNHSETCSLAQWQVRLSGLREELLASERVVAELRELVAHAEQQCLEMVGDGGG